MAEFNIMSKQCPTCRAKAVEKIDDSLSFKPPTHHCLNCGTKLKTVHDRDALWAIPITFVAFGVMAILLLWLRDLQVITDVLRAAIIGGIAVFSMSMVFKVYMRGIVFRQWKE